MKIKLIEFNKEFFKVVGGSLAFTVVISMAARNIDKKFISKCDIDQEHAHYYTNNDNLKRPIVSEKNRTFFLNKTNEIVYLDDMSKDLINAMNINCLYDIELNKEAIDSKINSLVPYTEYEYIVDGSKKWKDSSLIEEDDILTGQARDCSYVYRAFKLEKNGSRYTKVPSMEVEDLSLIKDEYPYISDDFYKIVKTEPYSKEKNR